MPIRLTRTVKALLIIQFAMFVVQQTADRFFDTNLQGILGLVPAGFLLEHRIWQILTYGFLHAEVMHVALNMMMLAFIGPELEAVWGRARFLKYYFLCQFGAGAAYLLLQLLVRGDGMLHVPMIGSSGAIYGLLVAFGLLFGERVMLFMLLFPMKAKHFVLVLAGIEFFSTVFSRAGLSGVAHLGGMATGFAYLWGRAAFSIWQRNRAASPKKPKKRKSSHLKLVINNEEDDQEDEPKTWH